MASRSLNSLVSAAAVVIIVAGLRQVSPILSPVLLAAFLSMLCLPLLRWLQSRGLSFWAALTITLTAVCFVAAFLVLYVGGSLQDFNHRLPEVRIKLKDSLDFALRRLEAAGVKLPDELIGKMFGTDQGAVWFTAFLNGMIRSFSNGFIILIMMVFMLAEASGLRGKMEAALGVNHVATQRMGEIVAAFRRYIAIKSAASVATGLCIGGVLSVANIEFAVFWGFLAFLLNYIPSIGSLIAAIPAVALILITDGWGWAAGIACWYLAVNTVFGSLIEPRWQGEGLGLSPLVVFVSLFVWGWIMGPVGVLLSAPLTMIVKMAADSDPDTRWLAVLLGPPHVGAEVRRRRRPKRNASVS